MLLAFREKILIKESSKAVNQKGRMYGKTVDSNNDDDYIQRLRNSFFLYSLFAFEK